MNKKFTIFLGDVKLEDEEVPKVPEEILEVMNTDKKGPLKMPSKTLSTKKPAIESL